LPRKAKRNKEFFAAIFKEKLSKLLNLKFKLLVDKKILIDKEKKEKK